MVARAYTLAQLLPHRSPMLLLDELIDITAERITCGVTIGVDTLFCDGVRGVPAWTGIEYMAQTACCYAGLDDARDHRDPAICLLLGARRYQSDTAWFAIGSRLRVVSELVFRDDSNLVAFECLIYCADGIGGASERIVARGDIKAFRPRDIQTVLRGERI